MKIAKKLCDTCLGSFVPWHLRQIHNRSLCPDCLKLLTHRKAEWLGAIDNPAGSSMPGNPIEANIARAVKEEGAGLILEAESSRRIISAGFLAVILGRILLYGVLFSLIKSHHIAFYIFKGAIMADFVTWLIFGVLEISFTPGRFVAGFIVNTLIVTYLSDDVFGLPNDVLYQMMMLLGFIGVGLIKIQLFGSRLVNTIVDKNLPG